MQQTLETYLATNNPIRRTLSSVTYAKKCMYKVGLDLADVLVLNHDETMLFVFCPHQCSKPRLFCKPTDDTNTAEAK